MNSLWRPLGDEGSSQTGKDGGSVSAEMSVNNSGHRGYAMGAGWCRWVRFDVVRVAGDYVNMIAEADLAI